MLSKYVTYSFEIFIRCEKFVRNLHTCDKYEMGKLRFNSSLMRTVKNDVHADPNNRWTYVLWPGSYACFDAILLIFSFSIVY